MIQQVPSFEWQFPRNDGMTRSWSNRSDVSWCGADKLKREIVKYIVRATNLNRYWLVQDVMEEFKVSTDQMPKRLKASEPTYESNAPLPKWVNVVYEQDEWMNEMKE